MGVWQGEGGCRQELCTALLLPLSLSCQGLSRIFPSGRLGGVTAIKPAQKIRIRKIESAAANCTSGTSSMLPF